MELVKAYIQDKGGLVGKFDFVMDTLPLRKIHNLHEIVKLMVCAGYEKECSDVQAVVNLENENEKEQYLDTMFDRWMIALEVAMTILFPIEQQLCDHAVAYGRVSKWHLFKMLDIFEHLSNLIPKFHSLFADSSLLNEAIAVQNIIGEASRDNFMEMHNFIVSPYGHPHQITVEIMSYLAAACISRPIL
ncbi:exocyst complex component EXO70B1-like [Cicer arietinum]|uniref:exocyst complex component EXO70B1-like n=1 Tax=Cicer arietinum TaxID=3827 RepID=UPI003CC65EB2